MRIFFGATLPDETKNEIIDVEKSLRPMVPGARLEGADKLHITLQFIGDFEPKKVDSLFGSARAELEHCPGTSALTEIVGIKYFPNLKVKRGIWLDCRDDGSLAAFAGSLSTASQKYGIVPEVREFKAHITVARLRQTFPGTGRAGHDRGKSSEDTRQEFADLQKFIADGKLSVERFFPRSVALFESTLKPSGSEYRILYEYPLEKAGDSS